MPTVTISVDKIINQAVYAINNVNGYSGDLKTVTHTFLPNTLIGNVYSYVQDNQSGDVYLMFYLTGSDYNNFIATYVKADANDLNVPGLPGILAEIEAQKQQQEIVSKGIIRYYIEKYLPWIIGAAVVAIALPTIKKTIQK